MRTYRVRHNFTRSQPRPWCGRNVELFGQRNEGFTIQGESAQAAIADWNASQKPGNRLNPFYLTIEEVSP